MGDRSISPPGHRPRVETSGDEGGSGTASATPPTPVADRRAAAWELTGLGLWGVLFIGVVV